MQGAAHKPASNWGHKGGAETMGVLYFIGQEITLRRKVNLNYIKLVSGV